jgi:hypothetical protein
MNDKTRASGRAAHSILSYLNNRPVPAVSVRQPIAYSTAEPQGSEALEAEISIVLACVTAEMLHLGADSRHLAPDRVDVKRALALAGELGDGDPVDHLEPIFDDLLACLKSPKVKHAIQALAGALLRSPRGEMAADDAVRAIILALAERPADAADQQAHPRRIYVRP